MKLLKILLPIVLIFCLGEIYTRLTYKQAELTGFMRRDPVFHHIPPAHYSGLMHSDGDFDIRFTTNNKGMRGPGDYSYQKPPGIFRIAVMGDSFVFGVGVGADKTVPAILQQQLDLLHPGRYEVLNFGVNSYSPVLEYIYLKTEVVKYSPDLVLLMLDLCDVQDDYLYEPHIVKNINGDIVGCDSLRRNGLPDLWAVATKHSRLLQTIDVKLLQSLKKIKTLGLGNYLRNKFKGVRNKTEILQNSDIDNIDFDRFLFIRPGKDQAVVSRHWLRTEGYIELINMYLISRGIKLVLATYPYGHQVGTNQWQKGRLYWAFDPGVVYDDREPFKRMAESAQRLGIPAIDTYDRFISRSGEKLYYTSDGHWTEAGQKAAASAILDSEVFKKAISQ